MKIQTKLSLWVLMGLGVMLAMPGNLHILRFC